MTAVYRWKKSSRSHAEGDCVELALTDSGGLVRDSKNPVSPALAVDLAGLLAVVKNGSLVR